MMSANPARLLRMEAGALSHEMAADITVIDPDLEWTVEPAKFLSKSRNTPFAGMQLKGKTVLTIVGGEIVYDARTTEERSASDGEAGSHTGACRRTDFSRARIRRDWRGGRRSRLQHRDDRLPGSAHRPVLQGADGVHDVSGNRQRRHQSRGRGIVARLRRGLHRQGILAASVELALRGVARRLPESGRRRRHRGHRYARAGAPHPHAWRAGGGDLQRRFESRFCRAQSEGVARAHRARPRDRGFMRPAV